MSDLLSIAVDVASGLEFMHSKGYIHFDIKPDNILVSKEGDKFIAKIGDFGEAKKKPVTMTKAPGTIVYMAPELADLSKPPTEKVDIYSFGILLYNIFSSTIAYQNELECLEMEKGMD